MHKTFVEAKEEVKPGFPVGIALGKKEKKGQVGIEIECEGTNLPHEQETPSPWGYHIDHSLRGNDNGEYVLTEPIKFSDVPDALDTLWSAFKKKKTKLDESNRTSVHIHLNCQPFHISRLTAFVSLYFTFEEILTEWCGDARVGNLFTLRAKDAPATVRMFKYFIQSDGEFKINEKYHYAGLNPNALFKYGSLEIRSLRGCTDPRTILDWVRILERLYNISKEFENDPRELCGLLSGTGALNFFNQMLGDCAPIVRNGIAYDDDRIAESLYEGIRIAQDLCYCRDWSLFKGVKMSTDPFGRDPKTIMKKIKGAQGWQPSEANSPEFIEYMSQQNPAPQNVTWATLNDGTWATLNVQTAAAEAPPMPDISDDELNAMSEEQFNAWMEAQNVEMEGSDDLHL